MPDMKKELEREEIHRAIWAIADDLRGSVDGWDFKAYADSPMDEENVGEHVYQHILNNAKKYVYINTPYLIVDDSMLSALRLAAKSGVDIRIITPHRWDKWWVHMTTRSYYCIRRRPAAAGAEQNGRGAV